MAETTIRWIERDEFCEGGIERLKDARGRSAVWVDVLDPDAPTLAKLAVEFGLHPLSLEDCLHYPQRPKLDVFSDHVFMIWLVPHLTDSVMESHELDAFLGRDFLITVHREPQEAIDTVAKEAREALDAGPAWTLHAILDRAVDAVFPVIDDVADRLERLEDVMLQSARPRHLEELYAARRILVLLHKVLGPERDLLRQLVRDESLVSREAYLYFQDIGDHLARVADQVDTYRDVASGAMDIYLSSTSNRLNVIMKQLTIVTTILLPLSVITGIYGMNFRFMPELRHPLGYPGALLLMALVAAAMVLFVRRRRWW